jgi:U4/U6 small nuclear ribonucleoprotein PRP4
MGHGKKVLAADFNVDGFHLATGGDDHTVRIWDLRRKAAAYTLPAHSSLIGDVRWAPGTGEALATASFDGAVKVWCARDWSCLAELTAHDGKAMSVDFGPERDDGALVSSGFDRTFKLWAPEWE